MGWVLMREQDVQRTAVLTGVLAGKRTVALAATVLAVTVRQASRILIRFREDGSGGLVHKGRGRASNHRLNAGVREYAGRTGSTQVRGFQPNARDRDAAQQARHRVGRRRCAAG